MKSFAVATSAGGHRVSVLSLALLALGAAGCGEAAPAPAETAADGVYAVRAEIVRLPTAPGGDLYLRHESIPEFRDRQGETVGMMPMTMPFGVPADFDLSGLAAGDRGTATFEVRWAAPKMPLRLTRFEPLPPGTRLEFDPDETAADEAPATDPAAAQAEGETPR